MTLPCNNTSNVAEDDSDMFGPPHTSPPIRRNRPKVPMISAQLRMREVRKRILQLCVHKLERIKNSERNLRRSVCINNTYSRLTDDIRREKQHKYLMLNQLANESESEEEIFELTMFAINSSEIKNSVVSTLSSNSWRGGAIFANTGHALTCGMIAIRKYDIISIIIVTSMGALDVTQGSSIVDVNATEEIKTPKQKSSSVETDLETLDRELCALDAAMPLVDPEITQGAEQLEQAMVSRKRKYSQMDDEDNDRLVREALSQFYLPSNRLLSGIDDCPSHLLGNNSSPSIDAKRTKVDLLDNSVHHHHHHHHHHPFHSLPDFNAALELSHQSHQHQKDFEVIMDALRIGAGNAMTGATANGCNLAAMMMSGETGSVFHNLVVTSLET
ncbi:AAEL010068-PA [Aedes aegypti]|uniref:AAEL010068-PA n=1 Tax=Aedes aegypti TaxID=7159 RepID=Q16U00_AEDAE|nr:AAEL010068-PA [Aedes aegypti]